MTDGERIMDAINFVYSNQGYVDINLVVKMTGIPELVVINVLDQNDFRESTIKGQFIKKDGK